ncbi:MAG: hypothetical protein PHO01_02920 [Desulfotomaculaceae bacterium]|nr:hypothetical protein [Desulfotomaculaceae bacterium]
MNSEGRLRPLFLTWENGRKYQIDRVLVLDIRQAATMKAGGQGDRYTIRVPGKETYLFFEWNASKSGNNTDFFGVGDGTWSEMYFEILNIGNLHP